MYRRTIIVAFLVLIAGFAFACGDQQDDQREQAIEARSDTFARAEALHPVPGNNNFPQRESLVKFSERTDLANHPWYIYILGQNGNVIGYYVATSRAVNSCAFLSSTEDVFGSSHGNLKLTAPSLDGIYYGGSGASAGCDSWFIFDAATDAMIEFRGVDWFESDQPLLLDAEPITVATQ